MGPLRREVDVLLVEDDAVTAEMYAAQLRAAGWVVGVAEDGLKALGAARRKRPRLILLDVQLAHLDGLTVLEHLLRQLIASEPAVIMLSNSDSPEVVERALMGGARDLLRKSNTTPSQLVAKVAEVLGRDELSRSLTTAIE